MSLNRGDLGPSISWCCTAEDGTTLAEQAADVPVPAASMIKLLVLSALLRSVRTGRVALTDTVAVTRWSDSTAPGDGRRFAPQPADADADFPPDGTLVSLHELATWMIARSSNEATNCIVDRIGVTTVHDEIRELDCSGTVFARKLGDVVAAAAGLENIVTPRDLTNTMRALTGSATARQMLAQQQFPHIVCELPNSVAWHGSKSGWIPGVLHDVAAAGVRGTGTVVLAVCTTASTSPKGTSSSAASLVCCSHVSNHVND
ncbi:serine hydrolase [Curtobacterium sp. A7_M15]|uniref:serine hydrolase n=1 Tax=Curtobacterium sp. A7_M15 TaxID=3065241 RepID=UPI0027377D84|nr:serine hydrolase [Curtobacterium sp. A7_M15]MDP4331958.1 serine hydrolase [Curtobacterium sp. A7_M15]